MLHGGYALQRLIVAHNSCGLNVFTGITTVVSVPGYNR